MACKTMNTFPASEAGCSYSPARSAVDMNYNQYCAILQAGFAVSLTRNRQLFCSTQCYYYRVGGAAAETARIWKYPVYSQSAHN